MKDRLRRIGRFFRDKVAPWPGRLALDGVYFLLAAPYGMLARWLRRAEPPGTSAWRPVPSVSDTLDKAGLRY
jgi:hypothetical protein